MVHLTTQMERKSENVFVWKYNCPASAPVHHYVVKDNGHAWPGGQKGSKKGDDPSQALNATDVIWDFFSSLESRNVERP